MNLPTRRLLVLLTVATSAALTVGTGVALSSSPTSDQQSDQRKQTLAADLHTEQAQADAAQAAQAAHLVPRPHPTAPAPAGPAVLAPPSHRGQIGTESLYGGIPLPFRASELTVSNLYLDLRGQTYLGVYAGALPADPQQGEILVHADDPVGGNPAYRAGAFPTSQRDGAVTLTSVTGALVHFRTSHHAGTFNLATQQYQH